MVWCSLCPLDAGGICHLLETLQYDPKIGRFGWDLRYEALAQEQEQLLPDAAPPASADSSLTAYCTSDAPRRGTLIGTNLR